MYHDLKLQGTALTVSNCIWSLAGWTINTDKPAGRPTGLLSSLPAAFFCNTNDYASCRIINGLNVARSMGQVRISKCFYYQSSHRRARAQALLNSVERNDSRSDTSCVKRTLRVSQNWIATPAKHILVPKAACFVHLSRQETHPQVFHSPQSDPPEDTIPPKLPKNLPRHPSAKKIMKIFVFAIFLPLTFAAKLRGQGHEQSPRDLQTLNYVGNRNFSPGRLGLCEGKLFVTCYISPLT